MNIPVVLPSSPMKIWGKSVQGFYVHELWTEICSNRLTEITTIYRYRYTALSGQLPSIKENELNIFKCAGILVCLPLRITSEATKQAMWPPRLRSSPTKSFSWFMALQVNIYLFLSGTVDIRGGYGGGGGTFAPLPWQIHGGA